MMKKWLQKIATTLAACSILAFAAAAPATAGTIVLEGSDATSLHGDAIYSQQLFSYLKSDSYNALLPVFVLGNSGIPGVPGDTVYGTSLPTTLFGNYSAVYVQSPGGCCSERPVSEADQTAIAAFVAAGGSVAIQDYEGGLATLLGFDAPQTEIGGLGGSAGGPGCFDTEIVLPAALAKGFTQPGPLGCWGHQAYDMDYFGALGFTSLISSGPEFASLGSGVWSSFLAKGGELGGGTPVPAPATALLLAVGLLALARSRRKA